MVTILTIVHVVVCFFLIAIVLLQHGKGADIGATFGGSSQTVFGTEGPTPLLNKITTFSAIIFMMTSIALAYYSSNVGRGSVIETITPPPVEAPVETAPPAIPAVPDVLPSRPSGEEGSGSAPEKAEEPPAAPQEAPPAAAGK